MLRLIFKYVIPLALMLAVFLVGYNYYWGNADEKEKSQQIIAKFTDLGSDVVGLLQSEKQKYDAGKFDDALAKISERIAFLKEQVNSTTSGGKEFLDQLETLDQQKQAMEAELPGRQGDPPSGRAHDGDRKSGEPFRFYRRSCGSNRSPGQSNAAIDFPIWKVAG